MEVKEYLNRLDKMDIDSEKVEEIQKIYNTKLPESVKKNYFRSSRNNIFE